jgi:hypothetical protein
MEQLPAISSWQDQALSAFCLFYPEWLCLSAMVSDQANCTVAALSRQMEVMFYLWYFININIYFFDPNPGTTSHRLARRHFL